MPGASPAQLALLEQGRPGRSQMPRGEQREGSQYLLGVEVRDPSLGAERDVSLHVVGRALYEAF